jgi:hypothetical protein
MSCNCRIRKLLSFEKAYGFFSHLPHVRTQYEGFRNPAKDVAALSITFSGFDSP